MNEFNFRHVMERLGIPSNNSTNWMVGQVLQRFFKDRGIEPSRLLTEKTDPNPSVRAPHCIAHYPMDMLDDALEHISAVWENAPQNENGTQLQLL